jgi:hypothetical protein
MNGTKTVCFTMLGVGFVVISNATANEQYCTGHPHSWSCHNPIAPGPDLPDEIAAQSTTSLIVQTFTLNI